MTGTSGVWLTLSLQQSSWTNLHDDFTTKRIKTEAARSLQVQAWKSHNITSATLYWDHPSFKRKENRPHFSVVGVEMLHCKSEVGSRTNVKISFKDSLPQSALHFYQILFNNASWRNDGTSKEGKQRCITGFQELLQESVINCQNNIFVQIKGTRVKRLLTGWEVLKEH